MMMSNTDIVQSLHTMFVASGNPDMLYINP